MRPLRVLPVLVVLALAGCVDRADPVYPNEELPPPHEPAPGPAPAPSSAPSAPLSPYAGQETREIKALSQDEIDGYASGAGLGYALPAELNSYPGPLHALQMADQLGLTAEQRAEVQAIREEMLDQAIPLGKRYLVIEGEIEQRFRDDAMDPETLERLLKESAEVEAQLRYAHLEAHLDTKALMTPHQVAMYDEMRGYGEADHSAHEHG